MTRTQLLGRCSAAAATITLLAGLAAIPATARPDIGDPIRVQSSASDSNCSLSRIGTELVRCDNLTGGGITAPGAVAQSSDLTKAQPPAAVHEQASAQAFPEAAAFPWDTVSLALLAGAALGAGSVVAVRHTRRVPTQA